MEVAVLSELELRLDIPRRFQAKHPESHVGGSFGLFLWGFNLGREPRDFDIVMPFYKEESNKNASWNNRSGNDFDILIESNYKGISIEIDIKIDDKQKFQIVNYKDYFYRVSSLETILKYKKEYAEKGYVKHIGDMRLIETQLIDFYAKKSTIN